MMSPARRTAPSETPAEVEASAKLRGITWRSLLVGLLLVVPNAYWITVVEVRWYTLDGTSLPLFITPVFFLFWLVLLNIGVRRILPRLAPQWTFNQLDALPIPARTSADSPALRPVRTQIKKCPRRVRFLRKGP